MDRRSSQCAPKAILMDVTRSKRKGGREEAAEFSQQSILSAMDRFVAAVNNMDDTIMVPSRLVDMAVAGGGSAGDDLVPVPVPVPRSLSNNDMFSFYTMLNAVKNELIWGSADYSTPKPERRLSVASLHSYSDSDVESEASSEFDSGAECEEQSTQIAASFRQHMTGLFQVLHQLTDTANFLTSRYQDEVGGAS